MKRWLRPSRPGHLSSGSGSTERRVFGRSRMLRGLTDLSVFLFPFVVCFVGGQSSADRDHRIGLQSVHLGVWHLGPNPSRGGRAPPCGHCRRSISREKPCSTWRPSLVSLSCCCRLWFRRRDLLLLAPICVIASGLAFDLVAYVSGGIIWSLRYCIATVPLDVVSWACSWPRSRPDATEALLESHQLLEPTQPACERQDRAHHAVFGSRRWTALAFVLLGPSLLSSAAGMFNPRVGVEESSGSRLCGS